MKQEIVGFKKNMQKEVTVKKIAYTVMSIMKKHIGHKNSICRTELFREIFKRKYNVDSLEHWLFWEFVKKAMNKLRRDSNCFIANRYSGMFGEWEYFVIADYADANMYIAKLDENIKRIKNMQKISYIAVKEKWYKQEWILDFKERKLLGGK